MSRSLIHYSPAAKLWCVVHLTACILSAVEEDISSVVITYHYSCLLLLSFFHVVILSQYTINYSLCLLITTRNNCKLPLYGKINTFRTLEIQKYTILHYFRSVSDSDMRDDAIVCTGTVCDMLYGCAIRPRMEKPTEN